MRMTALVEDAIAGFSQAWRSTAASRVGNDAECRSELHVHRAMDQHPTRARYPGHRPRIQSHGGGLHDLIDPRTKKPMKKS